LTEAELLRAGLLAASEFLGLEVLSAVGYFKSTNNERIRQQRVHPPTNSSLREVGDKVAFELVSGVKH
jgi:hypothetical protein